MVPTPTLPTAVIVNLSAGVAPGEVKKPRSAKFPEVVCLETILAVLAREPAPLGSKCRATPVLIEKPLGLDSTRRLVVVPAEEDEISNVAPCVEVLFTEILPLEKSLILSDPAVEKARTLAEGDKIPVSVSELKVYTGDVEAPRELAAKYPDVEVEETDTDPKTVESPENNDAPLTEKDDPGVVVPTPTFPFASTVNKLDPDEDATTNGLVEPFNPRTERVAIGVPVPTPRRVLVLSKKKLALFCDTRPLVPINGTDPVVRPER